MNKFEQGLDAAADVLLSKFAQVRQSFSDSDVKGGHNERIIADFVAEITGRRVEIGIEIFDTDGRRHSDECDIALCNDGQPQFRMPLIAEGVDAVLQVKASLVENEVKSAFKNSTSVKSLSRRFTNMLSLKNEGETWERIPYYVVAFEGLKSATITKHVKTHSIDPEDEPDIIFVLGAQKSGQAHPIAEEGYVLYNRRKVTPGTPIITNDIGIPVEGQWICVPSGRRTLLELARALHTLRVPLFLRPPLAKYFSDRGYEQ